MSVVFETEILIPHIVYQKNPIKAIKGVLGNDVDILSYTISDAMTTNEEFLIKVVYSAVDFSPFEIYKVENIKKINTNSDKYVGKICQMNAAKDTLTHPCYVKLNANVKECYVKINTLGQNNIDDDIIYYGDIINSIQDVMTNFCSAFYTTKLSYHGTNIKVDLDFDKVVGDLLPKYKTNLSESPEDKKIFDDFQSMSHDYSRNYFDISYLKAAFSSKVYMLDQDSLVKRIGIYSFEGLSLNQLKQVLMKTKTGIFFLLSERTNPFYFIYIPSDFAVNPHMIEHFITVIGKDLEGCLKVI